MGDAERLARLQGGHARRLRGVLRASVGVERDRLRGPRLPAGLCGVREPRARRAGALGGAGGATLAQRLARKGWRVVIVEKGPLWDPDRDWVSDEKGSAGLYWTDNRIVGGTDPVEMGKNNSGIGVGGSMTHFAGYVPRFHPSDFEVRTRDGVGADWPISYLDLKRSFERVERELPVAGQDWPWGDPHSYPHGPHPVAGAASLAWEGA